MKLQARILNDILIKVLKQNEVKIMHDVNICEQNNNENMVNMVAFDTVLMDFKFDIIFYVHPNIRKMNNKYDNIQILARV